MSIAERIQQLKKERNAVILAHNYQISEVQDIADFVGDSLGLSIQASKTDAEVIVFSGVHFMAETAKILSPEKTVLLPEKAAGCLMADMIDADQLRALKAEHPGAKVLCYVNTSAAVKAECDLCCTSANAVRMVREGLREAAEIIFVPDKYLADYVSAQTGRSFIVWPGFCPTHARILPENVREEKVLHPEAVVIAHPECPPELRQLADCVTSTEGMCRYVRESTAREIIVATERGILHRLRKENPGKIFYPASRFALCMNMKLIQQEKILWALEDMGHEIVVPPEVAEKARAGIQRMLDFSE